MLGFLGEYEVTLDAKGRFLLPAGFKKQLPEEGTPYWVINRGMDQCLSMYTKESWEPIFEKVSKLNDFDTKSRQFRRVFLNGATIVEADSAGRLLIPKNLSEFAGLERDIVLVSAIDKIEVWDKAKYQRFFEAYSADSFSDLAQQVMGGKGDV
jgi:MraZ protein